MKVIILTEGGRQKGLGHISRCSSLYDELEARGIEVDFIIYGDTNDIEIIKNKKFKLANWLSTDFLNYYIKESDYCIVDSYLATEDLYKVISNRAKKSLFIDDNARIKYPRGVVVNPSLSSNVVTYPKNDTNCYLLGHKFIILRTPFIQVKREPQKTKVKEVLITLGGSDIHNLTPIILNKFSSRYPNIIFNVVIGNAFKNIDEIKRFSSKNTKLYENATAEEMKRVMLKSDIAITAAGQTIYELMATQTPFIPIKVAENQSNNVSGLKEFNLVERILDYNDALLKEKIVLGFEKMMDFGNRNELVSKYNKVIDGLGTKRIIDALTRGELIEDNYFLREIREEDIRDVFNLSNEDYVRKWSINTKKISWEEHIIWFENTIKSDQNVFYVVTDCTNNFLGQLRYKVEGHSATVSISLCKSIMGKGLSKQFLIESIKLISDERNKLDNIIAFISDKNIASKKLFEKVGFLLCENDNGMLKYTYSLNKGV
ncbi:UDP-2,4-diacetamido-2,4,6-trideoxy-beta-L-altropyranose hydrolase [Anaerobacillus alkalilacustris]|uniref:UDP-2,4-diacetamido-2,4, 6-trideoxy-beta-L-altropyranose hydrolase n=1 Tax=Anaerobacillus alkalilacustris TaxID=393763 RepID=A0A1S2LD29_9BACI|nr:UDP-2,4-diacetamido-2,4,6-trideoxy-beta-L-altropyranose hydrolase [Anaerobacillus alkalilacustris]OIJ10409.1 UDP-2,4-diacetamido-2,4,6-trideoxy-beta-L-altropyranose hydrolase [Anaerobacillus alkalilacustris]